MTATPSATGARVLVTGASGFVGQHVVGSLVESGYLVTGLQHRSTLPMTTRESCAELLVGDICDTRFLRQAIQGIDVVCHLAALIPENMGSLDNAEECFRNNALATLRLASEAARAGVRRFIYMSTANMYAPSKTPCTESYLVMPSGSAMSYFASKIAGEFYLTQIGSDMGLDVLILRVATPYGPAEPGCKVIPTFLRRAMNGAPLKVLNRSATFDFVYVDDVAWCTTKAVAGGEAGTYNVASGESTDLVTLAETVASLFEGLQIDVESDSSDIRTAAGFPPLSVEKARRTWNYEPATLADGLSRYLSSMS